MDPQTGLPEGESIVLPKCTFSRPGYYFVGWSTLPDYNEPSYQDRSPVYVFSKSTANLYAIWAKESEAVLISFDPNGGSGSLESFYVKSGWEFSIPFNDFTPPPEKEYYTCISYDTTPDGYSHYRAGGTGTFTEDTTLYAYWTPPSDPSLGGASEKYKGQMVWSPGVNIQDGDWVLAYPETNEYFAEWKPDCGWYDASQGTFNFCWAASASNVIHWWLDMNKDNVDKFFTLQNKSTPDFSYAGKGQSKVFALFVEKWRENIGGFTNIGFNWFVNLDDNDAIQPSARGQAAYFKDVFGETLLSESLGGPKRRYFNEFIVNALDNNRLITMGERNMPPAAMPLPAGASSLMKKATFAPCITPIRPQTGITLLKTKTYPSAKSP